ncbi:MAG: tetratricopeptide repeat protein [Polyangiales bacterium]|nr:tetratricopeptide repeat protein [Myxococcales bacterium]
MSNVWSVKMGRSLFGAVSLSMLVACGGGSTGPGGSPAGPKAHTDGGEVIKTASGRAVTQEAHDKWSDALAAYDKAAQAGWNSGSCSSVSDDFLDAAKAQGNKFAEAFFMAGVALERCDKHDDALKLYNRALESNPKYCSARSAVGLDQLKKGNASGAAQTFQRAISDDNQCTEAYVNLAIIQRSQGGAQVEEALKNLRRALAVDSNYLPAYNQMALLYLEQAKGGKQESIDLAQVVCRQAQIIDPKYAPIFNTWGLISMYLGNVIEALRFFEQAAKLDPSMFEAHMNFGAVTHSFRGYEDAHRSFAKAVDLRPKDYDAHIGLGASLRGLGKAAEAKAEYEKAVAIDASRPEAYFNLGVLYQDYMEGNVADLKTAKGYFGQFVSRAGSSAAVKPQLSEVQRRCDAASAKKKRRSSKDCRPGRLQNIDNAVDALTAAAAMQSKSGGN